MKLYKWIFPKSYSSAATTRINVNVGQNKFISGEKKIYIFSIRRCIEKYKKDLDGGGGHDQSGTYNVYHVPTN